MLTLRPYQSEAVSRIVRELETRRATLLVLPTGCGKTVVFCEVVRHFIAAGRRVLVLAHRDELLQQAADKLGKASVESIGIEKASVREDGEAVVVASVQTLRGERLRRFSPDAFGLVVVDECHHARSSTYMAIAAYFTGARLLGVTATPDRMDGQGLGAVFESCAHRYALKDAIRDGWLVPLDCRTVKVEGLDLRKVRTTAGDLNNGDLEAILAHEKQLHAVAGPLTALAGARSTVLFGVTIKHAEALAAIINRYKPGSARSISGQTPLSERRATLRAFELGDFQTLVNCALLTEGFDMPSLSCVAVARPTKSRGLYVQMIGRGTRPLPGIVEGLDTAHARREAIANSAKPNVLVLDFVGVSSRHRLACADDVLADRDENGLSNEAAEKAQQPGLTGPEPTLNPLGDELALTAAIRFFTSEVNPFLPTRDAPTGAWAALRATEKQLAVLRKHGFKPPPQLTRGDASHVISGINERRAKGLASPKQVRLLQRHGHPEADRYTIAEASEHIALLTTKWKRRRQQEFGQRG